MDVTKYRNLYFIGLKGSGMCALAILFKKLGYNIIGSDTEAVFYTDGLLEKEEITCYNGFSPANIKNHMDYTDAIVYSPAYSIINNEELNLAAKLYPCFTYPEALGGLSKYYRTCAVIGTHGKSTTTALLGTMVKKAQLPLMVLTGGRVADWDNNAVYYGGKESFIAEVCEYRNHFVNFYPNTAILTSIELDHPDFFAKIEDTIETFRNFLYSIDRPKKIIAFGDSPEIQQTIDENLRKQCIFYGEEENNHVCLVHYDIKSRVQHFKVKGLSPEADAVDWELPVPGKAIVYNTIAALTYMREWSNEFDSTINWQDIKEAIANFKGVSRRCEILYNDNNIIILDDYAHHPTAIKMTIEGIRKIYKPKRLIVDFMSHTHTRTYTFLDDFSQSFSEADELIVHDIYASARETSQLKQEQMEHMMITGEAFYEAVQKYHSNVKYFKDFEETVKYLEGHIQEGDVLVSMGAGDNFRITERLAKILTH